jgi:Uma2 family endonuclease
MPLYARSGIPEAWLVDLKQGQVSVHSRPSKDGYDRVVVHGRGEVLTSSAVPRTGLSVDDLPS